MIRMLFGFILLSYIFTLYLTGVAYDQDSYSELKSEATTSGFNWTALPATSHLNYEACYDGFECARLEVPLDWTNTSNGYKVQLAVIRLPASVPETDRSFGGSILVNPGGPGGSGIDVMRWTGYGIRNIVDSDMHFELVSWDPRGVHHSSPTVSCFIDDFQRNVWTYRYEAVGPMDYSNASLFQKWALSQSFGTLCEQVGHGSYPDGSNIAQFATTALVSRDMVEIIDQIDRHRSQISSLHGLFPHQHPLQKSSPALLNYWGYSYGTYLGNTFASMFPSRVGRMVLDSVVDTDDYTATGWFSNLHDYHKSLIFFYRDCFEAGPLCPLNTPDVTSPQDIAVKVGNLLDDIKKRPVVVLHDGLPDIVTFADITSRLLQAMYFPTWAWPELADILAGLIRRNGTMMIPYLQQIKGSMEGREMDETGRQLLIGKNNTNAYPPGYAAAGEASRAVMCGDGDDLTNLTVDDWFERLKRWHSQSSVVGWRWSEHTEMCPHWPKSWRPSERNRFKGPWSTQLASYDPRASPLLFIGGTADPVLPLKLAYKAAARHEGARVLVQDGPGHCTGYVNPSQCTWLYIKKFFATGILPENNTICRRDRSPWSVG